jgi:RNAse (barnase) inhibitor barstar
MKVIEKPVVQIEQATHFKDMQFVIVSLLKSLKNIYENSNFYKEARIVSFIDRLLDCILGKVKASLSINWSAIRGQKDYEAYDQEIQCAQSVITKFKENFFVANLMSPPQFGEGNEEEKSSN